MSPFAIVAVVALSLFFISRMVRLAVWRRYGFASACAGGGFGPRGGFGPHWHPHRSHRGHRGRGRTFLATAWDEADDDAVDAEDRRESRARGFGGDTSALLRRILGGLALTPDQEKRVKATIKDWRGVIKEARAAGKTARGSVADALRADQFDELLVAEATDAIERTTERVQRATIDALGRLHEVLDPSQRERLAELLQGNWRGFYGRRS